RRHEVLRTSFAAVDGQPVQVIAPSASPRLPVIDLRTLPEARRIPEAFRIVEHRGTDPFDLGRGPLLRCDLIQMDDKTSVVILVRHHTIADGWSANLMTSELLALAYAFGAARPSLLPDLPLQYSDFARWQHDRLRGEVLASLLAYWLPRLQGAAVLEMP